MKHTILLIMLFAFIFFNSPHSSCQDLALATRQTGIGYSTSYSRVDLPAFRHHKPNKKALAGGIIAGSGFLLADAGGICLFLSGGGDEAPSNTAMQDAGIGLIVVGLAAAITGGVFAIIGATEVRRGYSLQIIAPKSNEIGIAYNFK